MKIGIAGCTGRMGSALIKAVRVHERCTLAGASVAKGDPEAGKELDGVTVTDDAEALFAGAEAVIDFTAPEASIAHAKLAAKHKKILVIGTTGLSAAQLKELAEFARQTVIIRSPNMSLGVNLLFALTEKTAALLGEDYDIEINEIHHKHKKDAPSGTSLMLGEMAAKGRGRPLAELKTLHTGGERKPGAIGFSSMRGGDVVGDHTVIFAGPGERIELTHKAANRDIYTAGAIAAALWAEGKKPGLYSLKDVLGM